MTTQKMDTLYKRVVADVRERRTLPVSTYRLQFNRFFTFADVRKLVSYLKRLGVSHIYASPYLKARPDSLHGYDITNHNELNPSIGTQAEYDAMVAELHRNGMGQILDIVPNHMGIGEEGNRWWTDVLENGRSSLYSSYFDIDWEPLNTKLTYRVLLPILGDQYGKVLEMGELKVVFVPGEGRFILQYYEHILPIEPGSYDVILNIDKEHLMEEIGAESEAGIEYNSIITATSHLPKHWETDGDKAVERNREKEVIKRRLAALSSSEPRVGESIERGLQVLNGTPGDLHSFDMLDALLERQPYRLSFWRVATEEINYRRFFDVNELAAIRVDQPQVFEETHRLIMSLLRDGAVNGLRVDHVDGLLDPADYLRALQRDYFLQVARPCIDEMRNPPEGEERAELETALLERFEAEQSAGGDALSNPLYVVVEKILARGETLPKAWPIAGTTGYEFTNLVNGLFVDSANAKALEDIYEAFTGEEISYSDLVYESKQQIMRLSLSSEITILTNMLNRITESDRRSRDFTVNALRNAIRELIAAFPVYRTYLTPDCTEPDERDRAIIEMAVSRARRTNPSIDPTLFDFLREVLLLKWDEQLSESAREARWNFIMKLQQVTSPVTAKSIEDTAFYRYSRLLSLNEVGGEPDVFGTDPARFHKEQAARLSDWPYSLLTTGTHDTKRSEDVRARINVISEVPKEWRAAVRRWARSNRKHKRQIEGQAVPDSNEEYFLYQTLLGVWPFDGKSDGTEASKHVPGDVVSRLQEYMRKALNEAKVHTSWINTNEAYLAAVSDFVAAILRPDERNRFLPEFLAFQKRAARYGAFNSLAQLLLKLTSPGVPDIYRGTEVWDFSLVDPDNRRPVDYGACQRLLTSVSRISSCHAVASLLDTMEDGRVKLFVTQRALAFRQGNPDLFARGAYTPLQAEGKAATSVIAFARTLGKKSVLVVVPRLVTRLCGFADDGAPLGSVWGDCRLLIPSEILPRRGTLRDTFTGKILKIQKEGDKRWIALEEVLATFPLALLEQTTRGKTEDKEMRNEK